MPKQRRVIAICGAAVLLSFSSLSLSACTPTPPAPSEQPTSEAPSTTPPTTPAAEAPAASDRGPGSPIEAIDAYALCKAQTTGYYGGDFAKVHFAPFDAASVLQRDDQNWFVWIDVTDENREPELVDAAASNCIVGGSLGEPAWWTFGTVSNDGAEELIAHYNDPLGSA